MKLVSRKQNNNELLNAEITHIYQNDEELLAETFEIGIYNE